MKRYSNYKDSGVEWLGEIPEHWEVIKIKRLSSVKRGASPRPIDNPKYFDDNGEFAWVRIADVTASNKYLLNTTQTLSKLGTSLSVKQYPGDFFVSIAGSVGKPIITKIKCCIHDGFVYFPQLKINKEFIYYLFDAGQLFKGLGKFGTQLNLNTDTIGNIQIPLPPLYEIDIITYFLDHKLEQINHFISNKQRLIELLKEQKTAIINRAVTKGLNPHAPMKPSGIEWLGEIPEHWKQIKIKYVLHKIIDTEHKTAPFYENGQYLVVRTSNIKGGILDFTNAKYTNLDGFLEWTRRGKPEPGDILFTREAPAGEACLVPQRIDLCLGQRVVLFRVNHQKLNEDFGVYSIYGGIAAEFIKLLSQGATVPHFNMSDITNIPLLLPPINEQKQIVQYIKNQSFIINEAIIKIEKEIELIKEYRTTLISDAVTGKIDVRI